MICNHADQRVSSFQICADISKVDDTRMLPWPSIAPHLSQLSHHLGKLAHEWQGRVQVLRVVSGQYNLISPTSAATETDIATHCQHVWWRICRGRVLVSFNWFHIHVSESNFYFFMFLLVHSGQSKYSWIE